MHSKLTTTAGNEYDDDDEVSDNNATISCCKWPSLRDSDILQVFDVEEQITLLNTR